MCYAPLIGALHVIYSDSDSDIAGTFNKELGKEIKLEHVAEQDGVQCNQREVWRMLGKVLPCNGLVMVKNYDSDYIYHNLYINLAIDKFITLFSVEN